MELYTKLLLFYFLKFFSLIQGQNLCSSTYCGSGNVAVQYPFTLENETPPDSIGCSYIKLGCNRNESMVHVSLGGAGDFFVQKIDYAHQYIQLYDPGNCIMRRLTHSVFSLQLQSSPLKAQFQNYTFYVCPLDFYMNPIHCMSNSTNITIATSESFIDDHRCTVIGSWMLPLHDDTFFYLTWDSDHCKNCQESGRWGTKLIAKIVAFAVTLPGLTILSLSCCSIFCFHLMKMTGEKYDEDSAAAAAEEAPPATVEMVLPFTTNNTGLDESKITACTELVVFSESKEGICMPSGNSKTCSICLENYSEKETVSLISKCGHCFHASCIHQWLGKNGTCPVCRTTLSDFV